MTKVCRQNLQKLYFKHSDRYIQVLNPMRISEVEVFNFKSYYGRKVIGPFHDHFTCIIGPNGNGKSNIIDAMLFVFGFKSSKLRQDSLASLIHSSAFAQPDQAEVTVRFVENQNSAQQLSYEKIKVKQSEKDPNLKVNSIFTTVSRVVRSNGHSFYKLQGKKIAWNQLKAFLIEKGIDLEKNLFIILQGQVERLCELSPEKLVEYLEYVSGSDIYKQKIETLENQYVQKSICVDNANQRLNICRRLYDKAETQTFAVIKKIQIKIFLAEIEFLICKKTKIQKSAKLSQLEKNLHQLDQKLSELSDSMKRCQKNLTGTKQQYQIKQSDVLLLKKELSDLQYLINYVYKQKIEEKQKQRSFIIRDCQTKEKQLTQFDSQNQRLNNILNHQQEFLSKYEKEKQKLKLTERICPEKDKQIYQNLKQACTLQDQIKSNKDKLFNQFFQLIQQTKRQIAHIDKEVNRLKTNKQKNQLNSEQSSKLKVKFKKNGDLQLNSQKKKQQIMIGIQQLQRRLLQLEATKVSLNGHQRIIKQLKMAHQLKLILPSRRLPISTLREHIIIEQEYSVLVSAITPQLDYLVLENHEEAREVIQFLKARKIGRMSFILKDQIAKMMQGRSTVCPNLPANTKRIFDIGKALNAEFQKIWFWSVDNTLISDSMQSAMNAAFRHKPHFRVISKTGEFIQHSGTMTKINISQFKSHSHVFEDKQVLDAKLNVLKRNLESQIKKLEGLVQERHVISEQIKKHQKMQNELNNIELVIADFQQKRNQLQQTQDKLEKQKLSVEMSNQILESRLKILKQQVIRKLLIRKQNKKQKSKISSSEKQKSIFWTKLIDNFTEFDKHETIKRKLQISQQLLIQQEDTRKDLLEKIDKIKSKETQKSKQIQQIKADIEKVCNQRRKIIESKLQQQNKLEELQQVIFLTELQLKQLETGVRKSQQQQIQQQSQQQPKQTNESNSNKKKKVKMQKFNYVSKKIKGRKSQTSNNMMEGVSNIKFKKSKCTQEFEQTKRILNKNSIEYGQILTELKTYFQFLVLHDNQQSHQNDLSSSPQLNKNKFQSCLSINQQLDIKSVILNYCQRISNSQKQQTQKLKKNTTTNHHHHIHLQKQATLQIDNSDDEKIISNQMSKKRQKERKENEIEIDKGQNYQTTENNHNNKNENQSLQTALIIDQLEQFDDQIQQFKDSVEQLQISLNSFVDNNQELEEEKASASISHNDDICDINKVNADICKGNDNDNQSYQSSKLIFEVFFNSDKIADKGNKKESELCFTDFISNSELNALTNVMTKKNSKNTVIFTGFNLSHDLVSSANLDSLILNKLEVLYSYYKEKLIFNKDLYDQQKKNHKTLTSSVEISMITNNIIDNNPSSSRIDSIHHFTQYFDMFLNYTVQREQFKALSSEKQKHKESQHLIYTELLFQRQRRSETYLRTFNLINSQVNHIYHYLTKGNAQVSLTNTMNPFQGAEFTVRPVNKSWKSVNLLSGGEKTLTSLALIFACEEVLQFPFYFMDEIDAALDYENVTKLGEYIKGKREKNIQHIVISLRKNMYEKADSIVGIYKIKDVTHMVQMNMDQLIGGRS